MSEFFKKNEDLCVSDVTSKKIINAEIHIDGKRVQIKITEYDPELCKKIKRSSGFDDQAMIKYVYY